MGPLPLQKLRCMTKFRARPRFTIPVCRLHTVSEVSQLLLERVPLQTREYLLDMHAWQTANWVLAACAADDGRLKCRAAMFELEHQLPGLNCV
jgi:hypothetical protein